MYRSNFLMKFSDITMLQQTHGTFSIRTALKWWSLKSTVETLLSGYKIYLFIINSGHKCTKRIDGSTEVSYPDGTLKTINADGTEEQIFPDGRKTIKNLQGEHIILLPNGQKEIHTEEYKVRNFVYLFSTILRIRSVI